MEKSRLKDDWNSGTVLGRSYEGRFQIENGRVTDFLVCGTNAPEMFSAIYKVLSFRRSLGNMTQGEMTIAFRHQGRKYLCSINLTEHSTDPRIAESQLVAA